MIAIEVQLSEELFGLMKKYLQSSTLSQDEVVETALRLFLLKEKLELLFESNHGGAEW